MAIPTAPIEMACIALDLLGEAPISSLETPTRPAESIVARHFDFTRQSLLREYVWNFAKKRATCMREAAAVPDFDYTDAYKVPSDFLRFLPFDESPDSSLFAKDYDFTGQHILLNNGTAASIQIRYIADVTDVTKWDSMFKEVFALKLALNVAYAFAKSEAIVKRLNDLYTLTLPGAVSIDGQERPPKRIENSRLIRARRGLASGNVASPWTIFEE